MAKRPFRTKEAIKSFQRCLVCTGTLPTDKISQVQKELNKATQTLSQQDAEVSKCDLILNF